MALIGIDTDCCKKADALGFVRGLRLAASILDEASEKSRKIQFLYRGKQANMEVNAAIVKQNAKMLKACADKAAKELGVE